MKELKLKVMKNIWHTTSNTLC